MLVPVAHFQREPYSTFGNPFLIKIKEGETYEEIKERIRAHLDVPEKDFEKYRQICKYSPLSNKRPLLYIAFGLLIHVFVNYRLALVQNSRAHYLEEENIDAVRLKDFQITSGPTQGPQQNHNHHARPFIGLQHANKNSKRARYNYMEKPIKIYN